MKQRLRRPLALLLTVVMLLGLLPTAAFAVEEEPGEPVTASAPTSITLNDAECTAGEDRGYLGGWDVLLLRRCHQYGDA